MPNFKEFKERHYNVLRFLLSLPEFNPLGETAEGDAWDCMFEYRYPVDILEGFLQKGANPNGFDDDTDDRPLCVAADLDNVEYVDVLFRYGANPILRDEEGRLPVDCTNNEEILGLLRSSIPYMQLLYCFHAVGVKIDADSAADIIGYFPEFHP
jgi:ankyrin repeat protein